MKHSKRYSSYKSKLRVFKLALNVPPIGPHKTTVDIFLILSSRFLSIFFSKISNSLVYPMEKPKAPIIWKRSDRIAKRSEIWASWVWCTFDFVTLKVILGSFGAFAFFRNLLLHM